LDAARRKKGRFFQQATCQREEGPLLFQTHEETVEAFKRQRDEELAGA
jgi:hypothetical protein